MKAFLLAVLRLLVRLRYAHLRAIRFGRQVVFKGLPLLDARDGGRIEIGDGVTLNSRNYGYHINMHGPVKLVADRPGAFVQIGDESRINGACLHAYSSITVGKRCLIAANTQIIDGSGHDLSFEDVTARVRTKGSANPIAIEDDVWIGSNCILLPGITIGRGSVIAAGSVVTRDVPEMSVAAGNPARVVRSYGESERNQIRSDANMP